jgi:miniconductance mechanosensitive channel
MLDFIQNWLVNQGFSPGTAVILARSGAIVLVIGLSVVANFIAKRFIISVLTYSVGRTKTTWDDVLLEEKFFNRLANFAPALVIFLMTPVVLAGYDSLINLVTNGVFIYMIIVGF